jgi:hypothetical protein
LFSPTRQEQQERQLRQVEQEREHRVPVAQALVLREDRHRDQVGNHRRPDGEEAQAKLDPEPEVEACRHDRHRLPENGEPSQHQKRAQPDPLAAGVVADKVERGVRRACHQGRSVAVAGS